ncbi:MAG: transposase [Planctomycetes bacterium]|nr:transposase [Planctomycetota bacterium]
MLWAGIDWSDEALDYELLAEDGSVLLQGKVKPDVNGVADLFSRFDQQAAADQIHIAIETVHGPWVQALLDHGYCVYPINPKSADHFRKAMSAAGDKSDSIDRHVLALHLKSCHSKLRRLKPDDPALVALRIGCQDRIRLVEEKTAKLNELIAGLKTYYPAILGLFGDVDSQISLQFILAFPTQKQFRSLSAARLRNWLKQHKYPRRERIEGMTEQLSSPVLGVADHLQTAKVPRLTYLASSLMKLNDEIGQLDDTIGGQFAALPESDWISSLPGAGPTLGPSLLACIGRDATRFAHSGEAQALMGTAPVTRASGKSRVVHMRRACWKFARRTLLWFAYHSRRKCQWAANLYQRQKDRGAGQYAALRAVANKWLKIILAMQRTGQRYDESIYVHSRTRYLANGQTRTKTKMA